MEIRNDRDGDIRQSGVLFRLSGEMIGTKTGGPLKRHETAARR